MNSKLLLEDGSLVDLQPFINERASCANSFTLVSYVIGSYALNQLNLDKIPGKIICSDVTPLGQLDSLNKSKSIELRVLPESIERLHQKTLVLNFDDHVEVFIGSANYTDSGTTSNIELTTYRKVVCNPLEENFEEIWNKSSCFENVEYFMPLSKPNKTLSLLEYQVECVNGLLSKFKNPDSDLYGAILNLPTGAGKTITALFFLRRVFNGIKGDILWVAPRAELIEQVKQTLSEYSEYFPIELVRKLKVMTLQSVKKSDLNEKFPVIVVDEAHYGAADQNRMIPDLFREYSNSRTFRLGISATSYRADILGSLFFRDFFGSTRIPSDDIDLSGLRKNGQSIRALPNYETHVIKELKIKGFEFDQKIDLIGKNATFKDSSHTLPKNCNEIANVYERDKHDLTLVFCKDKGHVNAMYKAFQRRHKLLRQIIVTSEKIQTNTGVDYNNENREQVLRDINSGAYDVIFTIDLYTTGVDIPKIQSLFILRPTASPLLYRQMIGRGMRGPAFGGTEDLNVLDFIGDKDSISSVRDELVNHANLDDKFKVVVEREIRIKEMIEGKGRFKFKYKTVRCIKELDSFPAVFMVVTASRNELRYPWKYTRNLLDFLFEEKSMSMGDKKERRSFRDDWQVFYINLDEEFEKSQNNEEFFKLIKKEISTLSMLNKFKVRNSDIRRCFNKDW